jgi:hypothetical protein
LIAMGVTRTATIFISVYFSITPGSHKVSAGQ